MTGNDNDDNRIEEILDIVRTLKSDIYDIINVRLENFKNEIYLVINKRLLEVEKNIQENMGTLEGRIKKHDDILKIHEEKLEDITSKLIEGEQKSTRKAINKITAIYLSVNIVIGIIAILIVKFYR